MIRHIRAGSVGCFLVLALASSIALGACSTGEGKPLPDYRAELLSSDEIGGGELIHPDDYYPGPATDCGPDTRSNLPLRYEKEPNYVRYELGHRRIDLGVWDGLEGPHQQDLLRMKEALARDSCRLGIAHFLKEGEQSSADWRVEPVNFEEGVVSFRSVFWLVDGAEVAPPNPVKREGVDIYSSARAYGVINGKLVMVRIDDTTVEPPTEEELRALWDAQVAKVRYFKAIEHAQELLTPQSGHVGK